MKVCWWQCSYWGRRVPLCTNINSLVRFTVSSTEQQTVSWPSCTPWHPIKSRIMKFKSMTACWQNLHLNHFIAPKCITSPDKDWHFTNPKAAVYQTVKGCPSLNVWRTPHRATNRWNFGSFPQCLIIYSCISSTHGLRKFWLSPGRTSAMLRKNLHWLNRTQIPHPGSNHYGVLNVTKCEWLVSGTMHRKKEEEEERRVVYSRFHIRMRGVKKNVLYIGFKISLSRAYVYSDPCSVRETEPYLTKMYNLSPESV